MGALLEVGAMGAGLAIVCRSTLANLEHEVMVIRLQTRVWGSGLMTNSSRASLA